MSKVNTNKKVLKACLDVEHKEAKITLTPKPKSIDDVINYVNLIISTIPPTLLHLGLELPTMRPATEDERESGQYILVGDDAKLYKARRAIYDSLKNAFDAVIDNMFPDVVYKIACEEYNQHAAFEMTPEEFEQHKERVKTLSEKVLGSTSEEVHDSEGSEESSDGTTVCGA